MEKPPKEETDNESEKYSKNYSRRDPCGRDDDADTGLGTGRFRFAMLIAFRPKFNSTMAVEVAWLRGINTGLAAARVVAGQAVGPDRERSYLLLVQEIYRRRPTKFLSAAAGLASKAVLDWTPDMSVEKFDIEGFLDRIDGKR